MGARESRIGAFAVPNILSSVEKEYRKFASRPELKKNDSVAVLVHDLDVSGPFHTGSMSLSKGLASERALLVLDDPISEYHLSRMCDCKKALAIVPSPIADADVEEVADLVDDSTEEGFALLAQIKLDKVRRLEFVGLIDQSEDEDVELEELEVEALLESMDVDEG